MSRLCMYPCMHACKDVGWEERERERERERVILGRNYGVVTPSDERMRTRELLPRKSVRRTTTATMVICGKK